MKKYKGHRKSYTRGWPLKKRLAFYSKPDENGCHIWCGALNQDGYGRIAIGGHANTVGAHRVAWQVFKGPIPIGMHVLHKCDIPACINPNHLFLGKHKDNMNDMAKKLRAAKKLTPSIVRQIRQETGSQYKVAKKYGINQATIWEILNRKIWNHLP